MTEATEMTALLRLARDGDREAGDRMIEVVYAELRRLAGQMMLPERSDHTLQPTALVHEACLRLFDQRGAWEGREHFLAMSATVMRRVLSDHARHRGREKRGGDWRRVTMSGRDVGGSEVETDLVALDGALDTLSELAPRQARIVEMRYLAGMTVQEVANALDVSRSTIEAEWRMARAWLMRELDQDSSE